MVQVTERESIFSEPEPSDDLFGGDHSPKVQMPEPAAAPAPNYQARDAAVAVAEEPEEEQADLGAMRSRLAQERKSSSLAPTILVFLVPYAIFTTGVIAYLLMMWPTVEAMGYLMDPKQKNQKHVSVPLSDSKIPASLRTTLHQPLRIGQMEYTPLKITRNGDVLSLKFKAKNVSKDMVIDPIEIDFFNPKLTGTGSRGSIYTYLEHPGKDPKVPGGDLAFFNEKGAEVRSGELLPGQECTIELTTETGDKMKKRVSDLLAADGQFLWRVQVRRGAEIVYRTEMPLTAVIGIEFNKADIAGS